MQDAGDIEALPSQIARFQKEASRVIDCPANRYADAENPLGINRGCVYRRRDLARGLAKARVAVTRAGE